MKSWHSLRGVHRPAVLRETYPRSQHFRCCRPDSKLPRRCRTSIAEPYDSQRARSRDLSECCQAKWHCPLSAPGRNSRGQSAAWEYCGAPPPFARASTIEKCRHNSTAVSGSTLLRQRDPTECSLRSLPLNARSCDRSIQTIESDVPSALESNPARHRRGRYRRACRVRRSRTTTAELPDCWGGQRCLLVQEPEHAIEAGVKSTQESATGQ